MDQTIVESSARISPHMQAEDGFTVTCGRCARLNRQNAETCEYCGASLQTTDLSQQSSAEMRPKKDNTWICPKCGAENKEAYCDQCGCARNQEDQKGRGRSRGLKVAGIALLLIVLLGGGYFLFQSMNSSQKESGEAVEYITLSKADVFADLDQKDAAVETIPENQYVMITENKKDKDGFLWGKTGSGWVQLTDQFGNKLEEVVLKRDGATDSSEKFKTAQDTDK
ncbi:MAG: zinc ribbon domain-containing protein, partial [Erysipelotrichaceae bacterium]|nr:zinc ribbon domain-containing protein [Erysipelotrichaceae bacterium]